MTLKKKEKNGIKRRRKKKKKRKGQGRAFNIIITVSQPRVDDNILVGYQYMLKSDERNLAEKIKKTI